MDYLGGTILLSELQNRWRNVDLAVAETAAGGSGLGVLNLRHSSQAERERDPV